MGLRPTRERSLALARWTPGQQTLDTQILVQVGPVDACTSADQPQVASLLPRCVHQPGIPGQRHGDGAPIAEVSRESVLGNRDAPASRTRTKRLLCVRARSGGRLGSSRWEIRDGSSPPVPGPAPGAGSWRAAWGGGTASASSWAAVCGPSRSRWSRRATISYLVGA